MLPYAARSSFPVLPSLSVVRPSPSLPLSLFPRVSDGSSGNPSCHAVFRREEGEKEEEGKGLIKQATEACKTRSSSTPSFPPSVAECPLLLRRGGRRTNMKSSQGPHNITSSEPEVKRKSTSNSGSFSKKIWPHQIGLCLLARSVGYFVSSVGGASEEKNHHLSGEGRRVSEWGKRRGESILSIPLKLSGENRESRVE